MPREFSRPSSPYYPKTFIESAPKPTTPTDPERCRVGESRGSRGG